MEEQLSNEERSAILGQLLKPKVKESTISSTPDKPESNPDSTTTFGSLLEQSLNKRQAFTDKDNQEVDEVRKKVFEVSNFNILKNWRF